ncbi:MAG: hypothetical protein CSB13_02690 [Chloroflexi bacterium]|nr:MAG: hypothetical protein CSB13_02690 [Chloroflexota bacterium]
MTIMLAGDQRLSKSILWQIQRQFFLEQGVHAWQADIVPHYISTNPFMARTYSKLILGYLRDISVSELDQTQPIYIIELGAGSGRLAYHFLHQFHDRLGHTTLSDIPIKFVMTDFVPETLAFWQAHDRFQPWLDAGLLDFALFDAQAPAALHLVHENLSLTPDKLQNPFVLIANYFFDSIPQDSFAIQDGQLCENLLTVYSKQPEPNLGDPAIWDRLKLAYEAIPLQQPYYPDDDYNHILNLYEAYLPDTKLLFPNSGLDCLKFWQAYGNGRLLLISSDRGHSLVESLVDPGDPLPNLHGSFSMMVNYHAIGQYIQLQGGQVLQASHYQSNLQVAAYLLGNTPQAGSETKLAFNDAVQSGGPDDFFSLKTALEPTLAQLTLPQILSYLRLSGWDADIFQDCFPHLRKQILQDTDTWHDDVYQVLLKIWQQYLPLQPADPLKQLIHILLTDMAYELDTFWNSVPVT